MPARKRMIYTKTKNLYVQPLESGSSSKSFLSKKKKEVLKPLYQRKKSLEGRAASKIRVYGRKRLKTGTHPQQWRMTAPATPTKPARKLSGPGATLGPMGELGDDVLIEAEYFDALGDRLNLRQLSKSYVDDLFRGFVYNPLVKYMNEMIDNIVPKDTGALRQSLKNAMTPSGGSNVMGFPWRVILNTRGIQYASVVNNMPTRWLVHPKSYHRNKGKSVLVVNGTLRKKRLYDPRSKNHWYNFLVLNGRKYASNLFSIFIKQVAALMKPNSYIVAQQMFNKQFRNNNQLARSLFTYTDK